MWWILSTGGLVVLLAAFSLLAIAAAGCRLAWQSLRTDGRRLWALNAVLLVALATLVCGEILDGTQGLLVGTALLVLVVIALLRRG